MEEELSIVLGSNTLIAQMPHWATLKKTMSLLGDQVFVRFTTLFAEEQRARVKRFDKFELYLIALVNTTAQEATRSIVLAVVQGADQSAVQNSVSTPRPPLTNVLKMTVPQFDGKDGKEADSLVFWICKIEIALSDGQIYDARSQVAIALFNIECRGRSCYGS